MSIWQEREKYSSYRRERMRAQGIDPLVDATPVREHISELHRYGMSDSMIAKAAGLSPQTVANIAVGRSSQVQTIKGAKILRVGFAPHPGQTLVLPVGAARRLRALQAIGWDFGSLAPLLGHRHTQSLTSLMRQKYIRYERWAQIAGLYERLSMKPGPSELTRVRAARDGWQTPIEWEDYDIDDPRVEAPLYRGGCSRKFLLEETAEHMEEALRLRGDGWSNGMIAQRLGVDERTVLRYFERHRNALRHAS